MIEFPLEYALVELHGAKFSGTIPPELRDLVDREVVRFVDIVFIQKDKDGNTRTVERNDLDPEMYEMFVPVGEHVSSFFTDGDLQIVASELPKNSAAVIFIWENLWVADLLKAIQTCARSSRGKAKET